MVKNFLDTQYLCFTKKSEPFTGTGIILLLAKKCSNYSKKDYFEKYIMNILIISSFREEVGWYYFALTKKYSLKKKSDVKLFYEDMLNFMN